MTFLEREYYDFELTDGTKVDIYVPELTEDIDDVDYQLFNEDENIDNFSVEDDERIRKFLEGEYTKELESVKR